MIGQTVAHYRILEKIGEGGMGVVYKAEDTKLGRFVALKFPPVRAGTSSEEQLRLTHEARAAAALDHPNICTIHEIGEINGQPYIAMNLVDGVSLRERLRHGPLESAESLSVAGQIAEGLSAAHERGIIHRDIKPENIMINLRGQVKIMDFGLAKSSKWQTKITQEGSTPGTAAYMAPEQARGDTVDARADLWSLGVVIYEIMTGALPFDGSHPAAVMYSVLHESHRPLRDRQPTVPAQIESLVDRLLRKDPVQRPLSAQAVAGEIEQIRASLSGGTRSQPGVKDPALPSLAVLPFANMSTDAENEFFADGLTEDLITAFSKMENLRVVARTSAFQFKGKTSDVRRVGEQLNVGAVLEGSVRKSGTRLRVTAQLINVADGFHVWSERYDREMADVFEIQDDIARRIVDALRVKLLKDSDVRLVSVGTSNMEAYHLFLQGRLFWNQRRQDSLEKSVECFRRAIQIDPEYASAHAGMALSYCTMVDHGILPSAELHRLGRPAAAEALRLDPESPEAHSAMGLFLADDLDWEGAEKSMQQAIAANPGYATAHQWYAIILAHLGRLEDAVREAEKARDADPLSLIVRGNLASFYQINGQLDKARGELDKCLDQDPGYNVTHFFYGFLSEEAGEYDKAAGYFRRIAAASASYTWYHLILARLLYRAGSYADAAESLETWARVSEQADYQGRFADGRRMSGRAEFRERFTEVFGTTRVLQGRVGAEIAVFFVVLGDHDRAFAWLSQTATVDVHAILGLKTDYLFKPLRSDPRYVELLRTLRLPCD